jgi:imidazolonepropionase-like amidohydrolase
VLTLILRTFSLLFSRQAIGRQPFSRRAIGRIVVAALVIVGATLAAQKPAPSLQANPGAPSDPSTSNAVVITGARILDLVAGKYTPGVVVIEKGRIKSVTAKEPQDVPESATRLDLKNATLVPGLVDAHAWAAPTSDLNADYFYLLTLAHGVTTARVLDVRTAWGVSQRARVASGAFDAPSLSTSGRGIDVGASPSRWLFDAPDAASAVDEVLRQKAAGVDWIAGYENLAPDAYKAMAAALKGSTVRLSGRPGASSMADLVTAGVHSIEMLAYPAQARKGSADDAWLAASAKELTTVATAMIRAKTVLVPLLAVARARAFPDETKKDPSLALLSDARRQQVADGLGAISPADLAKAKRAWTSQLAFIKRFVKAGGIVATGSGFEVRGYPAPGVGVHQEIAALVEAGLTPIEAIRSATINGARMLGAKADDVGIKPGLGANLIVVEGDPLANVADLARISTIVRNGRVSDAKDLLVRAASAARGVRSEK